MRVRARHFDGSNSVNVPAFAVSAIAGSNDSQPPSARRLPLPPKAWPMTSPAREQAVAPVGCLHCGQPVPSRGSAQAGALFCCAGCQSVYEIVQASGLSGYYDYQERSAVTPVVRSPRKNTRDDPAFQAQHCRAETELEQTAELVLEASIARLAASWWSESGAWSMA